MVKCDGEGSGSVIRRQGLYSYFPRIFHAQVTSNREWDGFQCSLSTSACLPTCIPTSIPRHLTRLVISLITYVDISILQGRPPILDKFNSNLAGLGWMRNEKRRTTQAYSACFHYRHIGMYGIILSHPRTYRRQD